MLRRVEYNRRKPLTDRNSWSVRQTAIYHQLSSSEVSSMPREGKAKQTFCTQNKSIFLLISPSKNANEHLHKCYELSCASPWILQRLLVADSLSGWSDYMACLEAELKTQASSISCSSAQKLITPLSLNSSSAPTPAQKQRTLLP